MPDRARTICLDCTKLALPGSRHCETHQLNNRAAQHSRDRNAERRISGLKKLYDSKHWRKHTVPVVLLEEPLCQIAVLCGGRAASTDIDHIVRAEVWIAQHGGDQLRFFDRENLRGACHADHSRKTAMENAGVWIEPAAAAGGSG
jgi:5-methylcytosine-specific restriction protein A